MNGSDQAPMVAESQALARPAGIDGVVWTSMGPQSIAAGRSTIPGRRDPLSEFVSAVMIATCVVDPPSIGGRQHERPDVVQMQRAV